MADSTIISLRAKGWWEGGDFFFNRKDFSFGC